MKFQSYLWYSLLTLSTTVQPLNILLHSELGGFSHVKYLLEISKILVDRQHNVTYASLERNANFVKGYPVAFNSLGSPIIDTPDRLEVAKGYFNAPKPVDPLKLISDIFSHVLDKSYDSIYEGLTEFVNNQRPDVMICDFFTPACRDVAYMNNVPLINGFQATDFFNIIPSTYTTKHMTYGEQTTEHLNLLDRFDNVILEPIRSYLYLNSITSKLNQRRIKYNVPFNFKPFGDFSKTLGIANAFVGLETPVEIPSNINMIGPVLSKYIPSLDSDLSTFLEQHTKTLYISFGSSFPLAPNDIQTIMQGILMSLDSGLIDSVIWGLGKISIDNFPEFIEHEGSKIPSSKFFKNEFGNIRFLTWAPQRSLLNHQSIKLFLSHGGLESAYESILASKPILCLPITGDQPRNARKIQDSQIGVYLDRYRLTPSSFKTQVQTILEDKENQFAINLKRMQTIASFNTRRQPIAVDLIESVAYTAQHCRPSQPSGFYNPGCEVKHLIPASTRLSFLHLRNLDVFFIAGSLILLGTVVSFYVTKFFIARVSNIINTLPKEKIQ